MSDVSNAFDHCVIMGDLNYRLDFGVQGNAKMPSFSQFQHMLHLIRTGAYKKLFEKDQVSCGTPLFIGIFLYPVANLFDFTNVFCSR